VIVQGQGSGWVPQKMAHMRLVHIGEMLHQNFGSGLEWARKNRVSVCGQTSTGIAEEIHARSTDAFTVLLGEFGYRIGF